jgi:histidine ammonia-lyase
VAHAHPSVNLDGRPLTLSEVRAVADGSSVQLSPASRERIQAARQAMLAKVAAGGAFYGINTGFGSFAHVRLGAEQLRDVQANLIRSHASGVGDLLPNECARATMLVLAASLARGHSGVRPEVVERIIALLNAGITPCIPSRGSVGASGDLAPLAHLTLALLGEGDVIVRGAVSDAHSALRAAGIEPLVLDAKEGLALINGTHMMAGIGALTAHGALRIMHAAICANAMAIDACRASAAPLDERIHAARNQLGQSRVAAALASLLEGSAIGPAHASEDPRVQDPYSLRASPQVLGAALDAILHASGVVEAELGAVTDNPLVFADGSDCAILSGANFHGMPLAISLDVLRIALCHVAGIAERRIYWALSGHDRESRLPPHLAADGGLQSGFMVVQYAAAACCNELRTLAYPSSVGNISTCAGIEDYNSMGATSALHAADALGLARDVVACELLVMSQSLEHQRPLTSGRGVERAHALVREFVAPLTADRPPAPDIAAIASRIAAGAFHVPALDLPGL